MSVHDKHLSLVFRDVVPYNLVDGLAISTAWGIMWNRDINSTLWTRHEYNWVIELEQINEDEWERVQARGDDKSPNA